MTEDSDRALPSSEEPADDRTRVEQLELMLAQERARADTYQRLLERMPGIVYVDAPDDDGTEVFTSPRMAEILGWTAYSSESNHWLERVVHPDDRDYVRSVILRTNRGERVAAEYRCFTASGEIRWVNDDAVPEFDAAGNVVAVHGYITDVTDLKHAEEEQRLAEERYRTLLEELPAAVYVATADTDGSLIFMSKRIERILGYPAGSWVGPGSGEFFLDEVVHPDDRARIREEILENAEGVASVSEYRCRHLDGRVVWIHDESTPELDAEGNVVAVRGFLLDITDRKAAEDELRLSDQRLRAGERMESIGRLAGGVAHDFNNLLTVIEGNVDLMLASATDELREGLSEVAEAARRASTLTNQLLAYSRQQVLQPHVIDLNAVVERLGTMLQRLLGAKLTLELRVGQDLWPVRVDRGQLEQVVVNLTLNARDAMPEGGVISIETSNRVIAPGDPQHPSGEYVTLAVTDRGVGFDEPVRASMFEPFFTTKPVGKGTGLGLATVDGIVRQSGGWVDVVSSPGMGATFTVVLPRSFDPVETLDAVPAPPPLADVGDATILVVEDTGAVRDLVARTLESTGYTVLTAPTGEAALDLLTATDVHVDLLLTDLVMPGLDGHTLARHLAATRPGLRVVYMSGYTYDEIVRHGIETAEVAFLPKPFLPGTLVERVQATLDAPAG